MFDDFLHALGFPVRALFYVNAVAWLHGRGLSRTIKHLCSGGELFAYLSASAALYAYIDD